MIGLDEAVQEMQLVGIFTTGQHDYDWAEFRAWQHPSGRLYWFTDGGCSCTEFGDGFGSPADFSDGDRDALERAFRAWADEHHEYCPEQVIIEGMEKLRRL